MSVGTYFTAAMCLIPWLAIWSQEWRIFTMVTAAPLALALLAPLVLPESARYVFYF